MWVALLFVTFVAAAFVGSLYVIPAPVRRLSRDAEVHIKWRFAAILVSLAVSGTAFVYLFECREGSCLRYLGLVVDDQILSIVAITCCLMGLFYLGPLCSYVLYTTQSCRTLPEAVSAAVQDASSVWQQHGSWIAVRNLIFAPVAEELAFRGLVIGSLAAAISTEGGTGAVAASFWWLATRSPLWFGAAHAHHLYEKLRSGLPLWSAALSTLVQFTYTYIFGCIAAVLLMRTGSLYSAMVSHAICNFVGLPDVSFLSPPQGPRDGSYRRLHAWRYLLLAAHAAGLCLFALAVLPATAGLRSSYS